ncbi:hypothetical protein B0T22DRAFT_1865 [Podospora appendiculata]|uniref:DUF4211 domain-containing protein n=1 Tax=Podospora appendiculata TaxID=314037 RepID=A0AAE1CF33_9PEZI|nr:hypothetical protein B0T22DRAFT_1865 [Podospora appendiculata]
MPRAKKAPRQQTLEATLGQPRLRAPLKTPRSSSASKAKGSTQQSSSPAPVRSSPRISSSFMPTPSFKKRKILLVDSSSSSESDDELAVLPPSPVRGTKRRSARRQGLERDDSSTLSVQSPLSLPVVKVKVEEDDDDAESDDDKPLVIPSSALRQQLRKRPVDESDEDDKPLVTPSSALRQPSRKRQLVLDDSDDDDDIIVSSPVKRRRLIRRNESSPARSGGEEAPTPRPMSARKATRRPRTEKEKARELLRRKRAGETIEEEDEEEEEEVEAVKAVYDTDSDNPALRDFEDDDEGIPEPAAQASPRKSKSPRKKSKKEKRERTPARDSDSDVVDLREDGPASDQDQDNMDDFVVDDGDEPLGVPGDVLHEMPLQFTQHSHKPLKEHFRDVVEWLVLFKINPGFPEQRHELYMMAWKKLDDEVRGLAQSKFASSAWRKDFYMALRARPYFTNVELPKGEAFDEFENCGACGRRGHPARWSIQFSGPAYCKTATAENFLLPIEPSSNSDTDTEDTSHPPNENDNDEDEDGNPIPKESKRWLIGSVCNSNAETAHNLIHWKHALLDWVDTTLEKDGHMAPDRLQARLKMRPRKKYKLVDEILETWTQKGILRALYRDFRGTIEEARNKTTTGRFGRR